MADSKLCVVCVCVEEVCDVWLTVSCVWRRVGV